MSESSGMPSDTLEGALKGLRKKVEAARLNCEAANRTDDIDEFVSKQEEEFIGHSMDEDVELNIEVGERFLFQSISVLDDKASEANEPMQEYYLYSFMLAIFENLDSESYQRAIEANKAVVEQMQPVFGGPGFGEDENKVPGLGHMYD